MTAKTMREMLEVYCEARFASRGESPNCSGHARAGFLAAVSLLMPAVEALAEGEE